MWREIWNIEEVEKKEGCFSTSPQSSPIHLLGNTTIQFRRENTRGLSGPCRAAPFWVIWTGWRTDFDICDSNAKSHMGLVSMPCGTTTSESSPACLKLYLDLSIDPADRILGWVDENSREKVVWGKTWASGSWTALSRSLSYSWLQVSIDNHRYKV